MTEGTGGRAKSSLVAIGGKTGTAQTGGNHGYDNLAPEMQALFVASGPAFVPGQRLAPFINVDVEPLLRDLIGLAPKTGIDGTDAPFKAVLRGTGD